jgi:hypothetical protein
MHWLIHGLISSAIEVFFNSMIDGNCAGILLRNESAGQKFMPIDRGSKETVPKLQWSGLSALMQLHIVSWGVAPGWYEAAPSAL